MKAKTYEILTQAIEHGISVGHMRAFKHTDTPSVDDINYQIYNEVMNSIHEVFDFTEDGVYNGK